jgi:DNA-binding MarR family transcriptional regulator
MPSRLQEEIKQTKPFPSASAEAMLSILRTAAVLDHAAGEALKPYGVTPTQYNVLRILRGTGPNGLCGREVGERLVAQVPDVPRLLDRMEEMGLVSRERDPSDRRHVTARITEKGLRLLDESQPTLDAIQTQRFANISSTNLQTVIDTLAQIRGNA